jgi:hypothetical protein
MKCKSVKIVMLIVAVSLFVGTAYGREARQEKSSVSDVIAAVLKALYPAATIEEATKEQECFETIEVELEHGDKDCTVEMTADGTILGIETEVGHKELPDAVAKAIEEKTKDAKIQKIEKEEIRAVIKVVTLPEPQTVYEASYVKNGKVYEVKVASSGKVLSVEQVEGDDEGDEHPAKKVDKDDDDEGDEHHAKKVDKDDDDDDDEHHAKKVDKDDDDDDEDEDEDD